MPNHIQNRLKVIGKPKDIKTVLDSLKTVEEGKEIAMDFNKIIPMPEGMNMEVSSQVTMWAEIVTGQIDFSCLFTTLPDSASNLFKKGEYGTISDRLHASTSMDYILGKRQGNVKDLSEKDFDLFIQCLKNYRQHGHNSWYEWNMANWGTKWNAYSQPDKRNTPDTIFFQTAWSSPIKLISILSEKFPSVSMVLTYADEDSGSNTGRIVFKGGEPIEVFQPESQTNEGYELFFELHPDRRENYQMSGGKYEYVETD